ncbi:MAG TPA: glycosyltransferase family 2 protein [Anaerolineales bacterium]|nr:glycosyltransferase family 2 protein [Anaerolineales bacterium]
MTNPLVISIILNTNRREDTLECLRALAAQTYPNQRAIVLDNHSTDGSVEAIRAEFPQVEIIPIRENQGYAGNNNFGIQAALEQNADWIFVLNEDTVMAEDCVEQLIRIGESDPKIGILGPMVYHHDEPEIIQSAGGIITKHWGGTHLAKNEPDTGQYSKPHRVDWISGCAILLRREAIQQAGMLDPRFFYYWEETEWCLRIGKAGWKVIHVPAAKLWHKGVQRNYQPKPSLFYYDTRNHLLMLSKHHAPLTAKAHLWLQTLRTLISWSIKPKWRSKKEHRNAIWRGMLDFVRGRFGQMPS